MKSVKRISALLLAALMVISLAPASAFARAAQPVKAAETIVGWDFESNSAVASTDNANNTGAAVTRESSDITFAFDTQAPAGAVLMPSAAQDGTMLRRLLPSIIP